MALRKFVRTALRDAVNLYSTSEKNRGRVKKSVGSMCEAVVPKGGDSVGIRHTPKEFILC